ncbi:MAG TPA: coproporphyrinogen dehydrogenase HemZ [Lachnospiraceae bacterium]|nr:coproporphyrinogen dehydrogenase HemZ [Lachnospiraceae bacterium]
MITIVINRQEYAYDTFAMISSFYPGVEIRQLTSQDEEECIDADLLEIVMEAEKAAVYIAVGEHFHKELHIQRELPSDQEECKKFWKREFYDILVKYTERTLPWGNLTGIRPTKLMMSMMQRTASELEKALDDESVITSVQEQLYETHRVGEKKARLGMQIASLEHHILEPYTNSQGYSIYIGIPFCPSTCLYCSFTSNPIVKWKNQIENYLHALQLEIQYTAKLMGKKHLDTVYIGGGTPTTLTPEELRILLHAVNTYLPMHETTEFTVEAGRADSITREKLQVLMEYGVNRISVNPQTMKDETLRIIGRHHTVQEFLDAYALTREVGFQNINMDIILGLPGETLRDVEDTLKQITQLSPDSLTVHSLAIKRASKMKGWMQEHDHLPTMDYEKAMMAAANAAECMNMLPYYLYRQKNMAGNLENTGYARNGQYGIYNILIMEEVQSIVALGAGSVSKRVFGDGRIERCDNVKDVSLYLERIDEMLERKRQLFEEDTK